MPSSTPTPRPRPAAARPGKTSATTAARSTARPKPASKAATTPTSKRASTSKPAARPAAKVAIAKPAAKVAGKSAGKPAAKPAAAKPTAKPAATMSAKQSAKPATKPVAAKPAAAPSKPSASAGPAVQSPAPDFSLAADDGRTYSLAALKGTRFVLYFYPRDNTPGCTTEACDFRDRHAAFNQAKVPVLGVSGDNLGAHAKFRGKYSLPFPLLSDPDHRVAAAFGAFGEKNMYGRKMQGIVRSTFVVGPTGLIEAVWRPAKVPGHAEAVLQVIRGTG